RVPSRRNDVLRWDRCCRHRQRAASAAVTLRVSLQTPWYFALPSIHEQSVRDGQRQHLTAGQPEAAFGIDPDRVKRFVDRDPEILDAPLAAVAPEHAAELADCETI